MPFSTADVLQAYDGELFAAPFGTAIPADLTTALDPLFEGVGWITEDGLTMTPGLTASDPIAGWPRGEILLRPSATLEPEFGFSLAQHDAAALDWIVNPSRQMSLVLEYRASVAAPTNRLVLPKIKISEAGEIPFNIEDILSLEITVGCERDDTVGVEYTFAFLIPGPGGVGTVVKKY